ncbi:HlyD family efflux transporter periplasmic adaptor subunit [Alkaliphilus hydrothermalis]|uniref:Membrane fusion protein n=1 Tax=Alkaliphilus hydrothermalis TaxID=1482730 RepID=A0ABS2NNL8_9FIRM|nr:HlyD family efflux transporter periplasmic adaptor subunit [Alkaliphilus hydrothermalis]MBM7614538.1 putative membrane fusion protein [Alkaliphilus hydrothermalis]
MQTKKKRKRKQRGYGRLIVISIISLYFLSRVFPILGTSSEKTLIVEYGKIENAISATGYIAREEKVFTNTGVGEVKYFVKEGEKVSKGQKLAEVYLENLDDKYLEDLEIINHRIASIQQKQDEKPIFQRDIDKLDQEINAVLSKIQQDVQQGEYKNLSVHKKELKKLAEKQNVINGDSSFAGRSLSQLEEEKELIEAKIKTSLDVIYSDYPGFIAFGQDGFEEILNLKAIEAMKVEDLETIKKNIEKISDKDKDEDKGLLRIINSHQWSIIFKVETEKLEGVKEGREVDVRPQGNDRGYKARVRKIISQDQESLVILDLTELVEGFYHNRTIDIDVIFNTKEGIILPNKAILEKDGEKGVYRVEINGMVKFVPIKIKSNNREYTIVHDGTFDQVKTDDKGEKKNVKVNTIQLYDEIVVDAEKVKEGNRMR